jgi:hypothetical protein
MSLSVKEKDSAVRGLSIASLVCATVVVLSYWNYVRDVASNAPPVIVQFDESFFPGMIILGLTAFALVGLAILFKYGE